MKRIVQKPRIIKIIKLRLRNSENLPSYVEIMTDKRAAE